MLHTKRQWSVTIVDNPEKLAWLLTQQTWTSCSGFMVKGHEHYLFLNDSFSPDGAQEYAVIMGDLNSTRHRQIESVTFSWCAFEKALRYISQTLEGGDDENEFAHDVVIAVEPSERHERCQHCA